MNIERIDNRDLPWIRNIHQFAVCFVLCACLSCSTDSGPNSVTRAPNVNVEDGGVPKNPDGQRVESFFDALRNVKTAEEEKQLLAEFGVWLQRNEYKIRVEVKNGKHHLSCPWFPPVTPWTTHSFLDIKNLDLLPLLDDGE